VLSEAEWEQFERDGYLVLGQVISDAELEALSRRMDEIMLGRARYEGMFFQLDSETGVYSDVPSGGGWVKPTLNYRKIEQLERDSLFLAYLQHPVFREITRRVYGEDVAIYRAMFMNKPAQRGTILPYHQDGGTQWSLSMNPLITVWTALDDSTAENGCVQIIPGSHKLGLLSERGHTITPEQEAEHCADDRSVLLEVPAGTAVLLHNWLLHRSGVNTIDRPRRAFSVCYMDAATRSTRNAAHRFPLVFGAGALRPAEAVAV
jgi:ectoine hydroxylase-related dioxygenase (phytanoyl-CoA dioxygenase family)